MIEVVMKKAPKCNPISATGLHPEKKSALSIDALCMRQTPPLPFQHLASKVHDVICRLIMPTHGFQSISDAWTSGDDTAPRPTFAGCVIIGRLSRYYTKRPSRLGVNFLDLIVENSQARNPIEPSPLLRCSAHQANNPEPKWRRRPYVLSLLRHYLHQA